MKIAISAGDPSGDEHAARIVTALHTKDPTIQFFGMGGSKLREAGIETVVDSETEASVMGFADVVKALPKLYSAFKKLVGELKERRPDVLLLVDYQDFNIRLAKEAKKLGIRTFFFIAPTVWAWRPGRVKDFKKYIDHLAVIFPFEPEVFKELGYSQTTYVGHPLTDRPEEYQTSEKLKLQLRKEWEIPEDAKVIALFPGSRKQEIKRLLKIMMSALESARKEIPELHAVIPVPTSLMLNDLQDALPKNREHITIVRDRALDVLKVSNSGIIKSGTSNLQAAIIGLPFTMVYNAGWFTELMVRLFVNRRKFSIVNIIKPDTVREIIQREYTSKVISAEMVRLANDSSYRKSILGRLEVIKTLLKEPDGFDEQTTAERVASMLLRE